MATFNWLGGSADWNTPTQWNAGKVPGANDTAVIAATGAFYAVTVGASDNVANNGVIVSTSNATLEIDGTMTASGRVAIGAGTIAVKGSLSAGAGISDDASLVYIGSHVLGPTSIYFDGLTGGTLVLQDVDSNTPATLTLSSTTLIQQTVASATITSTAMNGETIINDGRITAAAINGSMTIAPLNFINNGIISAFDGEVLTIGGNWSNSGGTIAVASAASLAFTGTFTTAGIGAIIGANGINLSGTLNNAGATLAVGQGSPIGIVNMQTTGIISGGTIVDVPGNSFIYTGNATFNAVTYQGPLDISNRGGELTITNGLTITPAIQALPGVINITGGGDATLNFFDSQTFDNATINLDGTYAPDRRTEIDLTGTAGSVLTFGPALTVSSQLTGALATIRNANGQQPASLVNKGTISAAAALGSFTISLSNGITNQGTITVTNGDVLSVQPGSGLFNNTAVGSVSVSSGSMLQIVSTANTPPISNAGTITLASGATLDLFGYYTMPSLGKLANQGGITQIEGTLDGQGQTLALGPGTSLGSVVLAGNIRNATVETNGAFSARLANASLLNDTVQGVVTLADTTTLTVNESVTFSDATGKLAGTVNVTGQGDSLRFSNVQAGAGAGQTLDNVTINLGNSKAADTISPNFSGGTFTVGGKASIVSQATSGMASLTANPGTSIVLNGTLSETGKGGVFTIPTTSGAAFYNNGTMIVGNGGTLSVITAITAGSGPGTIDVNNGGVADFTAAVPADQILNFRGTAAILGLVQPTKFAATIDGYLIGDTIDLVAVAATTAVWTPGTGGQPGTLTMRNLGGTTVAALSLLGDYTGATFNVVSDNAGGSDVTTSAIATCYAAGTRILTTRGEVAVERLCEGDLVLTVSGKPQPIRWIGRRHVDFRHQPNPRRLLPNRIMANAFGEGRPRRDLLLSPDHAVFVDNVLIPIRHLENATTVAQIDAETITYYHIELPHHDVVFAEGMPVESYLEAGARDAFANGGGVMQLHPDFAPPLDRYAVLWETAGYAPLVIAGEVLRRARRNLARQAAMLATTRRRRKPRTIAA